MLKLAFAVLLTAALVAFAVANSQPAAVSLVVGAPLQVPQIVLLLSAAGAGAVGTLLLQQRRRAARRRVVRQDRLERAARLRRRSSADDPAAQPSQPMRSRLLEPPDRRRSRAEP
jgi:uncharacterized integral membrane protein